MEVKHTEYAKGAIHSLSLKGFFENKYNIKKRSYCNDSISFDYNDCLIIPKTGDIYNVKRIQIIEPSDDFKLESLDLYCGDVLINKFNMTMCEIMYNNNQDLNFKDIYTVNYEKNINYNIPWKEYGYQDALKLVCVLFHNIKFKVNYSGICRKIYLHGYHVFLENEERKIMLNKENYNFILNTDKQEIKHEKYISSHILQMNKILLTNGLFLENFDIENIISIEIKLKDNPFIRISQYNYKYQLKKIKDNFYYLPFDENFNYLNCDINSSINILREEKFEIIIKCNNDFIGNIYCNGFNSLKTIGGYLMLSVNY